MAAYRWIFALAAVYNTAFGLWAGFWPSSFFTLFGLEPPLYPSIWACLGMVVGVYALAYAAVAWKPAEGTLLVGIGLLGKALGPAGWLVTVSRGELPARTFPLILANDLVWWFPFLFYLLRDWRRQRTAIAWTGIVLHIAACGGLMLSAGGTEMTSVMEERLQWITEHPSLWAATWLSWSLASLSLVAFCTAWAAHLIERGASRLGTVTPVLVCAVGVACDLMGETMSLSWPLQPGRTVADFAWGARAYAWWSVVTANGLYCLAGLVLSATSWRLGFLRGRVGGVGLVMWTIGLVLSLVAVLDLQQAMMVTGGAVMALYIPWAAIVGWKLREKSPQKPVEESVKLA